MNILRLFYKYMYYVDISLKYFISVRSRDQDYTRLNLLNIHIFKLIVLFIVEYLIILSLHPQSCSIRLTSHA